MRVIRTIAGLWLVALLFFIWGVVTVQYRVFPWKPVNELITSIDEFVKGHSNEPETTVIEKLISDAGGVPYRYLIKDPPVLDVPEGAVPFRIDQLGLKLQGYHQGTGKGYILLSGAFSFEENYNQGAVLLSTSGELVRHWPMDRVDVGTVIDVDRGVILQNQHLQRIDWCEGHKDTLPRTVVKPSARNPHHAIEVAPDGTYWTSVRQVIVQVDPDSVDNSKDSVRVMKGISLFDDLPRSNPHISPLTPRFRVTWTDAEKRIPEVSHFQDPFHINDVQPFVDDRFETAYGYALLVSVRNINLLMVVDPATGRILWHAQGYTDRQHDVDYFEGDLYVYDNGTFRGYSTLVRMGFDVGLPGSDSLETIIDGREIDWYDPTRGQHEVISLGGRRHHLLVNDRNGRALLFDQDNTPVFAVQNFLDDTPGAATGIQLRSALYVSDEDYEKLEARCL